MPNSKYLIHSIKYAVFLGAVLLANSAYAIGVNYHWT
jgi:hypothetical protein